MEFTIRDFESWMASLAAVQGTARQRIVRAWAAVLGDKTAEWMTWANLEHLPSYASAQSIALIASERQLDTAPGEATSDIAERAPFWLQLARFYGRGLGILLGLHFSGFDDAVLVQQNGRALSLTLPLPTFELGQEWDPTPNLVVTPCSDLAVALTSSVTPPTAASAGRSIPSGNDWWTIDSDTDFCSRFEVLFPGPLPSEFMTVGTATFAGTSEAVVVWNNAFADTTYHVQPGIPVISGGGPVSVVADLTTKTLTGVTLLASGAFTGTVTVLAWQNGANPYADPHPSDLARLRETIAKWKPAKATCVGTYALVQGNFFGWPVATFSTRPAMGSSSIAKLLGAF